VVYYVAETDNGQIVDGGGIYQTEGLPEDTCELIKMYLLPIAKGKRLRRVIIEKYLQKFLINAPNYKMYPRE